MTDKSINKEFFAFRDDTKSFFFAKFFIYFLSLGALPTAVVISKGSKLSDLPEFGMSLGFDTVDEINNLKYHDKRLIYRAMILYFFILPSLSYFIYSIAKSLQSVYGTWNILLSIAVYYLGILVAVRLLILFVDNNFADSLCIDTVFQIVFILSRDDVLTRPDRKEVLIHYINYLEKYLARIGDKYTKGEDRAILVKSHFTKMSHFVNERKKWAVVPKDSTLSTLREDFYNLAKILISGKYGNFEWTEVSKETAISNSSTKSITLISRLFKFIGYIIPTILLGIYLWKPELFPNIMIEKQVVTYILLGWLLISIDIGFNLGVVSSLISTAKGLRDIEKA